MQHLPVAHGFDEHYGFLAGSGSYTTLPRWDNQQPVGTDHEYSTDRFGSLAVEALKAHDAANPFFLYLPWQAVHTPEDLPPHPLENVSNIHAMLFDADEWVGRIVDALKQREMSNLASLLCFTPSSLLFHVYFMFLCCARRYDDTLIIFSADNGGVSDGNNFPLRGEKHTNWQVCHLN